MISPTASPAARESVQQQAAGIGSPRRVSESTPRRPSGATILAADDDPGSLGALRTVLHSAGHLVVGARGGDEAITIARATRPEMILLDITMPPGIDGYETVRRLRSDPEFADVPIIMLSSRRHPMDKVLALELGAVDYITKPFRAEEVIARVSTHLTIRRLRLDLAQRNDALEAINRRMKTELEAAGRIQLAMLPRTLPQLPDYDVAFASRPCHEAGGDLLDVFEIGPQTLGCYLLDVSGHGVASCLLAVSIARSLTPRSDHSSLVLKLEDDGPTPVAPSEVLRRVNALNPMVPDRNPHFVTMIYGLLDRASGRFRFACAGHPGPIVTSPDGVARTIVGCSLPLGLEPGAEYNETIIDLSPGDRLFLHSDGLFEQRSQENEQFGLDRLRAALGCGYPTVSDAVEAVMTRVPQWAHPCALSDDLSLLGLGRLR